MSINESTINIILLYFLSAVKQKKGTTATLSQCTFNIRIYIYSICKCIQPSAQCDLSHRTNHSMWMHSFAVIFSMWTFFIFHSEATHKTWTHFSVNLFKTGPQVPVFSPSRDSKSGAYHSFQILILKGCFLFHFIAWKVVQEPSSRSKNCQWKCWESNDCLLNEKEIQLNKAKKTGDLPG